MILYDSNEFIRCDKQTTRDFADKTVGFRCYAP